MKILKYNLLLIASALLVTLSACNKSDVTKSSETTKTAARGLEEDYAANPDNPYDDAGYYHNIGLQATRSAWSAPHATRQDGYDALVAYSKIQGYPIVMTNIEVFNMTDEIQADAPNNCVHYVNSTSLSANGKMYTNRIFSMGSQLSNYATYDDYRAAMIKLEATVSADPGLSASDMQRVLSAASVARHSILYWAREAAGDNGNPGTSGNPNAKCSLWGAIKKWWNNINWTNVVVGDIGGAVAGIPGGLPGIIFGSLGGSIVGSAT